MVIPYGSEFWSTLKVKAWIPIRCEHCSLTFAYLTSKKGEGSGDSTFWLDNRGAKERARRDAVKNLQHALLKEHDSYPCPRCGKYQNLMVHQLRRKRRIAGISVCVASSILWAISTGSSTAAEKLGFWAAGTSLPYLLLAVVAAGALVTGFAAAATLDADSRARNNPPVPGSYSMLNEEEYRAIKDRGYRLVKE